MHLKAAKMITVKEASHRNAVIVSLSCSLLYIILVVYWIFIISLYFLALIGVIFYEPAFLFV